MLSLGFFPDNTYSFFLQNSHTSTSWQSSQYSSTANQKEAIRYKAIHKMIRFYIILYNCLASNLSIGMLRFVLPLYVIINFALSTAVSQ